MELAKRRWASSLPVLMATGVSSHLFYNERERVWGFVESNGIHTDRGSCA